jgi:RHS repeat-associated protein
MLRMLRDFIHCPNKGKYFTVVFMLLFAGLQRQSMAQENTIPAGAVVSREVKPLYTPIEPTYPIINYSNGSTQQVFMGSPCLTGNYFMAFQLLYDLGDFNTQQNWTTTLTVMLVNGTTDVWVSPKTLVISSTDQTFLATVFHDVAVSCNVNYKLKIISKSLGGPGTPPQNNIYLKIGLYKDLETGYDPTAALTPNVVNTSGEKSVFTWSYIDPDKDKGMISFDAEWVFIESHEGFIGTTPQEAFQFKEPVRINTAFRNYTHSTYYPNGKLYYRVRSVGFDPNYVNHRIPGLWFYFGSPINISNQQPDMNWQEQVIFAEEGKYKKVMTYFDGSLRQRQSLTNLSSQNLTMVGESMYDFEGRKSIDILPAPVSTSVQWTNLVNVSNTDGTLTKTAGTANWNAGASSIHKFKAGEDFWIEVRVDNNISKRMFGLSSADTDQDFPSMKYSWVINAGNFNIFEGSTDLNKITPVTVGDILTIERKGTTIYYRHNGKLIRTSTVASTTDLIVDVTIYNIGDKIIGASISMPTMRYFPKLNPFLTTDNTIISNTSARQAKFNYDNGSLINATISSNAGAGKYYSPVNPVPFELRDYIPNAEGYVYSQTEYVNDGTGRVKRQAGAGSEFKMDGSKQTQYFYGSPTPVELTRLFGSNVGNPNHYKKNLVVDPNGQANVTYLDQEGRAIATALAGVSPNNVTPLAKNISAPLSVDVTTKNVKKNGQSILVQKILNSTNPTNYTFQYSLASLGSQLTTFGCVDCKYDLKITITDPDGVPLSLGTIAGNQAADAFSYERKGLTATGCSTPTNAVNISFPLTFNALGDYTVTKIVTAQELTFEEAKTMIQSTPSVITKIQTLQSTYTVDNSNCDVCLTGTKTEDAITATMSELVDQDCENIYQRLVQELRDDNPNMPDDYPSYTDVMAYAKSCQYTLCLATKSSELFDKQMSRVKDWSEAGIKGYTSLATVTTAPPYMDPFFQAGALGYSSISSMQSKLNNVYIGTVSFDSFSDGNYDGNEDGTNDFAGSILQVIDPTSSAYFVDVHGNPTNSNTTGYHLLYYDLMGRRAAMGETAYLAELNIQRWALFKAFYQEAKRKTKLAISDFQTCTVVKDQLALNDLLPRTEEEIRDFGIENGAIQPISDNEVESIYYAFKFTCKNALISSADQLIITNALKNYFNSKPHSLLRIILTVDVGTNPNLNAIQTILTKYNCATLTTFADTDPLNCVNGRIITYPNKFTPQTGGSGGTTFSNSLNEEFERFSSQKSQKSDVALKSINRVESLQDIHRRTNIPHYHPDEIAEQTTAPLVSKTTSDVVALSSVLPSASEYAALIALYNSTNGPGWTYKNGWSTANPNVVQSVEGWYGVLTDAAGHITHLDLDGVQDYSWYTNPLGYQEYSGNNLTGTVPSQIGNLTYLILLNLGGNNLTGSFPNQLSQLSNLLHFIIPDNQFTGSFPSSISNCTNLIRIFAEFNQFSGSIPVEITTLKNLRGMQLDHNNFSGSIPAEIVNMRSLTYCHLYNNQLTGSIPENLDLIGTLYHFEVNDNKMIGKIPVSASRKPLNWFCIANNKFSGNVPNMSAHPYGLDFFTIERNLFTFENFLTTKQNTLAITFTFAPQDSIDVQKTLQVTIGNSRTLTTSIDRKTSPVSIYQWFRYVNGTSDVALNTASATGHTFKLPTATIADNGKKYYYKITNTAAPGLTLVSRMQTIQTVANGIKTVTICTDVDPANKTIAAWTFKVDSSTWAQVVQRCIANATAENVVLIEYATQKLIEDEATTYYTEQRTKCLTNLNEQLTYNYSSREYQYTLYYYDQAGNLVQTVPPEGVNTSTQAHTFLTRYQNNSINQAVWQQTPDAGQSRFYYNNKGQLKLSQNAQQLKDNNYSYTRYDAQGRITEVGELNTAEGITALLNLSTGDLDQIAFPTAKAGRVFSDITKTYYDVAAPSAPMQQDYLRNRVSYVEVLDKGAVANDVTATYYSYDIHGNVKSLLQQITGLPNKRTDYRYDLVSGNVNYVFYQYNAADQFIHRYKYDADNRITDVMTSTDGYLWDTEAQYKYYPHGPLARIELGEYNVQGLDYYYTLQGWIKGMNMPFTGDLSNDGNAGTNLRVGRDVFAYTLGYFENDYKASNATITTALPDTRDQLWNRYKTVMAPSYGLYNGNIAWMITDLKKIGQQKGARAKGMQAMLYQYDQLHRIVKSRSLTNYVVGSGFSSRTAVSNAAYDENFSYDGNGNIQTLTRRDNLNVVIDNFVYTNYSGTNKLRYYKIMENMIYNGVIPTTDKVYQNVTIGGAATVPAGQNVIVRAIDNIDIDLGFTMSGSGKSLRAYVLPDTEGVFNYDAIGNLIWDQDQKVKITWTPYGKVRQVTKEDGTVTSFRYDGAGNRVEKKAVVAGVTTLTRYVRDASGNVMGVYEGATGTTLTEQSIYGSTRLGMYKGGRLKGTRKLGTKSFELSNHLGNVLSVITDNIRMTADSTWATVASANDYYAFGSSMVGRNFNDNTYRYGFNGKEKDEKGELGDTHYDYGFRIYNPRLGRFLSVDPLTKEFAWNSTYAFAENDVISCIDLDGLEKLSIHLRSFIRAKTTKDPLGRLFDGDGRNALTSTKEEVTARGRVQFSYDFKSKKGDFSKPFADETVRHNVFDEGKTTAIGIVNSKTIKKEVANGVQIGIHYDTKNPLTPSSITPSVDVDAGYQATFDEKSRSWTVGFYGKSDGYPSTETFVEDASGQRIMLGFKYEEGTPGKKLWGGADTEVFKGVAQIFVDENNNFKSANLINGDKKTSLEIIKSETTKK